MSRYVYPLPVSPNYRKPTSVEDCLPQARALVKQEHGRAAMGPVKSGDRILIVTYADQDEFVRDAVIQALKEAGAAAVDFIYTHELTGVVQKTATVEEAWREAVMMGEGRVSGSYTVADRTSGVDLAGALRKYFDDHPGYTGLFWDTGGRSHRIPALKEHGGKFRGNWLFNNWEEFLSRAWVFPDELWKKMEEKIISALGMASSVRITDPEGTHLEYSLTPEEAQRWAMTAGLSGHLFLDPLQSTSNENAIVPVSEDVPIVFPGYNGVLAGTANHFGFFPRMELHFEDGRLVQVKGGGRYGEGIEQLEEKYHNIQWPGYPDKGYFWFCDAALCTTVKAFRRTSDLFDSYWRIPNAPERNRAGVFHMGIGSRRHSEAHRTYSNVNKVPMGHIHVHNYFATFEVRIAGSQNWYKIIDKGWVTALGDTDIRALATKYGVPDKLLSYDWVPPLPGINCEGDYREDYAPDPIAYLRKRIAAGECI